MKRWLLTAAAFVCVAVGLAQAEYVIIVANVGQGKAPPPPAGPVGPDGSMVPGGPPPMGPGGSPPPMGPGGSSAYPAPPGGRGGSGPPPMGSSGYGPPPGMGAIPFGPGGDDGFGGFLGEDPDPTALYVVTVVETKGAPLTPALALQIGRGPVEIGHEWGRTVLAPSERIWVTAMPSGQATLWQSAAKRWKTDHDRFIRDVPREEKPSIEGLIRLAGRALELGLLKEYTQVMEKAVEVDKSNRSVAAYVQVRDNLAKDLPANKTLSVWKDRINPAFRIKNSPHYTMLHLFTKDDAPEVVSRMDRLEESFKGFYYWFALKGIALPMPRERLLSVLIGKVNEFTRIHQTFDGQPLVSDGFHARHHNLSIFSAAPTDETFTAFAAFLRPHLADKDAKELLRGQESRSLKTSLRERNPKKILEECQLQTAVLMQRALERDGELSSISHEVPRQLLAGAGLLPRNVAAPEWSVFGLGAFFETPRGAPWASYGSPGTTLLDQHNYLLNYKLWAKGKKLDRPAVQLEKCISDQYFRAALAEKDVEKAAMAMLKARTHAWALTYFLVQTRIEQLLAFYREMSQMPRDVEFDSEVLVSTFARAFGMVDREGKVNQAQFNSLADEWHRYIMNTPMELEQVLTMVRKGLIALKEGKHPGANLGQQMPGPNGPNNPGAPPGAPPGFQPGGFGGAPPGGN